MADVAISIAWNIASVAVDITKAVETVRQNKEVCGKIAKSVEINSGVLQDLLQETKLTDYKAMNKALDHVEITFKDALEVVQKCQKRHIICSFFSATDIADDLKTLRIEIGEKMQVATCCASTMAAIAASKNQSSPTAPPAGQEASLSNVLVSDDPAPYVPGEEARIDHALITTAQPPRLPTIEEVTAHPQPPLLPEEEEEARIPHAPTTTLPPHLPPGEEAATHQQPPPPLGEDGIKATTGRTAEAVIGILDTIVGIALQIKEAVETVQQNKEECLNIARHVEINCRMLERMVRRINIANDKLMCYALEAVKTTFVDALNLVQTCQHTQLFVGCLLSWKGVANELNMVQHDMDRRMQSAALCMMQSNANIIPTVFRQVHRPPIPTVFRQLHRPPTEEEDIEGVVSPPGFKRFSLSVLERATNNFSDEKRIGEGGFSSVYKGSYHDRDVAIKKFYRVDVGSGNNMCRDEFIIGAKLQHKNVVSLLGYCIESRVVFVEDGGRIAEAPISYQFLVLGYVPNGSLDDIVAGTRDDIDWVSCFKIIQEMAQGIHYIHEQRVIHLDLKPSNILLDSDMSPVIIDFGLSKVLEGDGNEITIDNIVGSLGFVAPEQFSDQVVSLKSDVYSFGITLLRTITTMDAHNVNIFEEQVLQEAGGLKGLLNPALQVDESQLTQITRCVEIGRLCVESDPAGRPSMAEVVDLLSGNKMLPAPKKQEKLVTNKVQRSITKKVERAFSKKLGRSDSRTQSGRP